jgi:hypothetical protein
VDHGQYAFTIASNSDVRVLLTVLLGYSTVIVTFVLVLFNEFFFGEGLVTGVEVNRCRDNI